MFLLQYVPLYANIFTQFMADFNRAMMTRPTYNILKDAFDIDIVGSLATLLSSSNSLYSSGFDKATTLLTNVMMPIGTALIITFFLINVIGMASRDALTLETFIKALISLVIVFTIASQTPTLAKTMLRVGDSMTNATVKRGLGGKVKAGTTGDARGTVSSEYTFDNMDTTGKYDQNIKAASEDVAQHWGIIGPICAMIIWLISKISQIGMYIAVISRGIELLWRTIFMPIGVANSFDGANSPGVRFIKNYLAVAVSGAMVIIIIVIGQGLSMSILSAGLKTQNRLMAMIMACAGLMATAGASMSATAKVRELFS